MKRIGMLKLAASAVVLSTGFTLGGGTHMAVQAAVDSAGELASAARKVEGLLAKKKTEKAVAEAERLVAARPDNANFRMLLGQSYLQAGRFRAASTSFSDVLRLAPGHDRAALNYALTKIALGQNDAALAILDENRDGLKTADYGLATALAGQTAEGVRILEDAARSADATPRTRQNLALAYALNGQWIESRAVMAQDLSPDLVDARIIEWAGFVRPKAAWDQVAALMKVTPAYDPGQPAALALNLDRATPQMAAVAVAPVPAPVATPEEVAPPAAFEVAQSVSGPEVTVALAEPEAPAPQAGISEEPAIVSTGVVFAPRTEIVQQAPVRVAAAARPAPLIRANAAPAKQKLAGEAAPIAMPTTSSGRFVVQLGAYSSSQAAARAWNRNAGRYGLSDRDPSQATIRIKTATLYRLSLPGFSSRGEAVKACSQIRSNGGNCFVRLGKSEAMPMWAKRKAPGKPVQLASRN